MSKLNITFCSFPDFSGNAKVLYEYMVNKYKDKMNYVWIVNTQESQNTLNSLGIKSFLKNSKAYEEYISKTDVFFTTHANLIEEKKKAKGSLYVELWHGVGPKQMGYLDSYFRKEDEDWYKFVSPKIDYLIVPSSFWKSLFSTMFYMDARKIKDIGLPVLDEIVNAEGKIT